MVKKKRAPKVVDRKLGREGAAGLHWPGTNLIEIDPRLSSKDRLEVMVHEALHYCFPRLIEMKTRHVAKAISGALWEDGYRRIYK